MFHLQSFSTFSTDPWSRLFNTDCISISGPDRNRRKLKYFDLFWFIGEQLNKPITSNVASLQKTIPKLLQDEYINFIRLSTCCPERLWQQRKQSDFLWKQNTAVTMLFGKRAGGRGKQRQPRELRVTARWLWEMLADLMTACFHWPPRIGQGRSGDNGSERGEKVNGSNVLLRRNKPASQWGRRWGK